MKYEDLAKSIVKDVGGEGNVNSLVHCVTRLRFRLKDEDKADTAAIEALDGVVSVVKSGGQYQVVIGNAVGDVFDAVLAVSDINKNEATDEPSEAEGEKTNLFNKFVDLISGIFSPLLGYLAATGMLKGLLALCLQFGWLTEREGTYRVLFAISDSFFYFLPVMLGYSAAKKFKVNEFLGLTIGAVMVYPTIVAMAPIAMGKATPLFTLFGGTPFNSPVYETFAGIPLIMMSYTSSVIPVIVGVWFAAIIERRLQKIIPTVVKAFLVPLFTLLIAIPLIFLIIGPTTTWVAQGLGFAIQSLVKLSPVIAGVVLGGFWQVMVMFGLHWGLIPVAMNNIAQNGVDSILALTFAASWSQIGAVLAVVLRTKDKKVKGLGISAFVSGIFGVTEPAIYGVTLPRKKPFYASLIGAGVGGALLGIFHTVAYNMGGLGVFALLTFFKPGETIGLPFYGALLAAVVGFAVAFFLTLFLAKEKAEDTDKADTTDTTDAGPELEGANLEMMAETKAPVAVTQPEVTYNQPEVMHSPLNGTIMPLDEINDPVFASGAMGTGVAIKPTIGKIFAPVSGDIQLLFPTKHAIGINSDGGAEILIHVGMDTVQLDGKGFTAHIQEGDHVQKGDLLLEFEIETIQAAGLDTITPIVVTNVTKYHEVQPLKTTGTVTPDDEILNLS
ncbi:beta-glucoside-specific PTS transporter subunit IIABC [Agrilactobacillus composti]|nr:beta-glucoside-specific PTS transporter subunit IIABC [Agrilactobacillus composti]